jgi:hypothetical protein
VPKTDPRSRLFRIAAAVSAIVATLLAGVALASPAQAYSTENLLIYLDASKSESYSGSGTDWIDLSGNGNNGVLSGSGLTFNPTTEAIQFPGGANGTAWVDLAGTFANFSSGMTIEFEGEFGAVRSDWERIFDFAAGIESVDNVFWVGQMYDSNELALEVWISGVNQGRCHTSTGGTALGEPGDRELVKWVLTVGGDVCRIYKDGLELPTAIKNAEYTSDTPTQASGSPYPLPPVADRSSAFLGRSNFLADNDLEGSIRYLRIYSAALTPAQVAENSSSDDGSGSASSEPELVNTGMSTILNTTFGAAAIALFALAATLIFLRRRLHVVATSSAASQALRELDERLSRLENRLRMRPLNRHH